jgi:hypothetical protein
LRFFKEKLLTFFFTTLLCCLHGGEIGIDCIGCWREIRKGIRKGWPNFQAQPLYSFNSALFGICIWLFLFLPLLSSSMSVFLSPNDSILSLSAYLSFVFVAVCLKRYNYVMLHCECLSCVREFSFLFVCFSVSLSFYVPSFWVKNLTHSHFLDCPASFWCCLYGITVW